MNIILLRNTKTENHYINDVARVGVNTKLYGKAFIENESCDQYSLIMDE